SLRGPRLRTTRNRGPRKASAPPYKNVIETRRSTPTRNRTWTISLEARCDDPFHYRGGCEPTHSAEGTGFEPARRRRSSGFQPGAVTRSACPSVSLHLTGLAVPGRGSRHRNVFVLSFALT